MTDRSIEAPDDTSLIATFGLGDALLGIGTEQVQEVVRVGDVTRVYDAPPYVIGIRNLRGRIVTVIDLAVRLGLPVRTSDAEARLLIVEWQSEPIGLRVDAVTDTMSLGAADVLPAPANVGGIQERYLRGVCRQGERLVALLNLDTVLQPDSQPFAHPAAEQGRA